MSGHNPNRQVQTAAQALRGRDDPHEPAALGGGQLRTPIVSRLFELALRVLDVTWHKEVGDIARLDQFVEAGQPHIIAFWHGSYVALFSVLRNRGACVVTNDSRRGDVIARLCERFGNIAIQIPDRGRGRESLELIETALAHSNEAAVAADGPLGPCHQVRHGLIRVASDLEYPLVPISAAAQRKFLLRTRWDRLEIPKPFSRVHLAVGEPMHIPSVRSAADVRAWSSRLHDALEGVHQQAAEHVRLG